MVVIVVPAYNEAENLPHLLDNLRRFMRFMGQRFRIVLVDDGSRDATQDVLAPLARRLPLTVLRHAENRGPGAAFLTGLRAAADMTADDDLILTIEADNTSDLCVVNKMIEQTRRGHDLVLASVYGRYGRVVGAPFSRLVLSKGANLLMKATFRIPRVNTFSSFFRLHRAALIKRAFDAYGDRLIEEPGFICMVELLVKLHHLGARITEVPMLLDANIRIGDSKMKVLRNIRSYLSLIYRYLFRDALRPPAPELLGQPAPARAKSGL